MDRIGQLWRGSRARRPVARRSEREYREYLSEEHAQGGTPRPTVTIQRPTVHSRSGEPPDGGTDRIQLICPTSPFDPTSRRRADHAEIRSRSEKSAGSTTPKRNPRAGERQARDFLDPRGVRSGCCSTSSGGRKPPCRRPRLTASRTRPCTRLTAHHPVDPQAAEPAAEACLIQSIR